MNFYKKYSNLKFNRIDVFEEFFYVIPYEIKYLIDIKLSTCEFECL